MNGSRACSHGEICDATAVISLHERHSIDNVLHASIRASPGIEIGLQLRGTDREIQEAIRHVMAAWAGSTIGCDTATTTGDDVRNTLVPAKLLRMA